MSDDPIPIPDDAPPTLEERDAAIVAGMNVRDEQLVNWLTLSIQLAAERHPDCIRTALASVFDMNGVKTVAERSMVVIAGLQSQTSELRAEIESLRKAIDDLAGRLDGCFHEADEIQGRLNKAAKWVTWLREKAKRIEGWIRSREKPCLTSNENSKH